MEGCPCSKLMKTGESKSVYLLVVNWGSYIMMIPEDREESKAQPYLEGTLSRQEKASLK